MTVLVDVYGRELKAQPQQATPKHSARSKTSSRSKIQFSVATALLPVRLFWGLAFLAAGLDKLFNPKFLDPQATSYIGNQLAGFARTSPLREFLLSMAVPNADIFGWVVLLGEIAIGLGILLGFLSRTAAAFGVLLNLILWISAAWGGASFFLIPELPFAFGFLALALVEAHPSLSLDGLLKKWGARRKLNTRLVEGSPADSAMPYNETSLEAKAEKKKIARRQFVTVAGATVLTGAVTGAAWGSTLVGKSPAVTAPQKPAPAPVAVGSEEKGKVLTALAAIPVGEAKEFVLPGSTEKAIILHDADGSVRAFSAACTHMGCDVVFDKSDNSLFCPCHSARFDCKSGEPTHGPANASLKSYKVQVDGSGNIVYMQA